MKRRDIMLLKILRGFAVALAGNVINQKAYDLMTEAINDLQKEIEKEQK